MKRILLAFFPAMLLCALPGCRGSETVRIMTYNVGTFTKFEENSLLMITDMVKETGADVISLKGATFDGIAMSAFRIVESILKNQNTVLPVAHVLDESYGEMAGSTISLPCVVNGEGIARTLKISMTDEELVALRHSAKVLKDFIADVVAND